MESFYLFSFLWKGLSEMKQISIFDDTPDNELNNGVLISKEVVSPLESKERLNSLEFKKEQRTWSKHLNAIASYHNCSIFKAREMLIKARDNQKKIMLDFDILF